MTLQPSGAHAMDPSAARAFVLALDGPAASGKSSVGVAAAKLLGFHYLDTGLLYRALAWLAAGHGVDPKEGAALARLLQDAGVETRPSAAEGDPSLVVGVGCRALGAELASPEVDATVSAVSAHPEVRAALRELQRAAIRPPGVILAGRDIGTVIAPDAPLKVWLTASPEERARRRARQRGLPEAPILADMVRRDALDRGRAVAPMVPAADAVVLDTEGMTPDAVVAELVRLARERGA